MKVYYSTRQGYGRVAKPVIHLENRFLIENGFRVGDQIEVEYRPHKLIIHKVADASGGGITQPLPHL